MQQWYATGSEYYGEYFGYEVTGDLPVALYKSIRFTPYVTISVLHPNYVQATTYIINFSSACSSAMIGDSSVTISATRPSPNVGAVSISANNFNITTGNTLGDYSQFFGTNAAYLNRDAYASYWTTGLPYMCFVATVGSYNPGLSPTSRVGPFPTSGPLLPLFYAIPAGVSAESHDTLKSTYNFRLLISPRYALTTSITVFIEYDYTACPLEPSTVSFSSTAATISVTTLRGTSPYTGCAKAVTGVANSVGVTCNGTYSPITHGDIMLTVSGLTVLREGSLYLSRIGGACFSVSIERKTAGFSDEDTRRMTGSFVLPSLLSMHQSTVFDDGVNNSTTTSMAMLLGKVQLPSSSQRVFVLDFPKSRFIPANAAANLMTALDNTTLTTMSAVAVTGSALSLSVQPSADALCNVQTPFSLNGGCAMTPHGTVSTAVYTRTDVLFDYTHVWDKRSTQDIKFAGLVPVRRLPLAVQRPSAGVPSSSLSVKPAGSGAAGIVLELTYTVNVAKALSKHIIVLPSTLVYPTAITITQSGFNSLSCVVNVCTGNATGANFFNVSVSTIVGSTAPYALLRSSIAIYDVVKNPSSVPLSIAGYTTPETRAIEGYEPFDRLISYNSVQALNSYLGSLPGPLEAPSTITVSGTDNNFVFRSYVTLAYTRILIQPSSSFQVMLSAESPHFLAGGTVALTAVAVVKTDGSNCTATVAANVASLGACSTIAADTILKLQIATTHTQFPVLPVWIDVFISGEKFARFTLKTPQAPQDLTIAPLTVPSADSIAMSITAGLGFAPTARMGTSLDLSFELSNTDATLADCANDAGSVTWLSSGAIGPACALPKCSFSSATESAPVERLTCTVSMLTAACLSATTPTISLPTVITLKSCVKYDTDRAKSPALTLTVSVPNDRALWRGQAKLKSVASKLLVDVGTWTTSGTGSSKTYVGAVLPSQCKQPFTMQRVDKVRVTHSTPLSSFMPANSAVDVALRDSVLGVKSLQPVSGGYNTGYFELSSTYTSALVCDSTQGGEITLRLPSRVSSGTITVQLLSPNGVKAEFFGTVSSSSVLYDTNIIVSAYTPFAPVNNIYVPKLSFSVSYNYDAQLAPNIVELDISAACIYSPTLGRNSLVTSLPGTTTGWLSLDPVVTATGPPLIYMTFDLFNTSITEVMSIYGLYCAPNKQVTMRLLDPVTKDVGDDIVYTTQTTTNSDYVNAFVRGTYELEVAGLPTGSSVGFRGGQMSAIMHLLIAVTLPVPITKNSVIALTGGSITQCTGGASVLTGELKLFAGATATAGTSCSFTIAFNTITKVVEPYTTIHVFVKNATLPTSMFTDASAATPYYFLVYTDPRVMVLPSTPVRPLTSSYVNLEVAASDISHSASNRAPIVTFAVRGQGVRPIDKSGQINTTVRVMMSTVVLSSYFITDNVKLTLSYTGDAVGLTIGASTLVSSFVSQQLDPVLGLAYGLDMHFSTSIGGPASFVTAGNFTFTYQLTYLNPLPEIYGKAVTFGVTIKFPTDTVRNVAKFTSTFPATAPALSRYSSKVVPVRVSSTDGVLSRVHFLGRASSLALDTPIDQHGSDGVTNLSWRTRVKLSTTGYLIVVLPPELAYGASTTSIETFAEFSNSNAVATTSNVCTAAVITLVCSHGSDTSIRGSTCASTLKTSCIMYEITATSVASQYSDVTFSGLERLMNVTLLASARGYFATVAYANAALNVIDNPLHIGSPGVERNWEFGADFQVTSNPGIIIMPNKPSDSKPVCSVVDPVALVTYTMMRHGLLVASGVQQNPANSSGNTPWGNWVLSSSRFATLLPTIDSTVVQCSIAVAADGRHIAINTNNNRVVLVERFGDGGLSVTGFLLLPIDGAPRTQYPGANDKPYTAKIFFSQWQTAASASLYIVTLSSSLRQILISTDGTLSLGPLTNIASNVRVTAITGDSMSETIALCGPSLDSSKVILCDIISIADSSPTLLFRKTVTTQKDLLPTAVTFCPQSNINTLSQLSDQCLFVAATDNTGPMKALGATTSQYIFRVSLNSNIVSPVATVLAAVLDSHSIAALGVTGYQSQIVIYSVSADNKLFFRVLTRLDSAGRYGRQTAEITHSSLSSVIDASDVKVHFDATRTTFFHVAPDCSLLHVSALPRLYDVVKDSSVVRGKIDWDLGSASRVVIISDSNHFLEYEVVPLFTANKTHIAFNATIHPLVWAPNVMNPLTTHIDANLNGLSALRVKFHSSHPTKSTVSALFGLPDTSPSSLSLTFQRLSLRSRASGTSTQLDVAFTADLGVVATKTFTLIFEGPFDLSVESTGSGTTIGGVSFTYICIVFDRKCAFSTTQAQFVRDDAYRLEIAANVKSLSDTFGGSSFVTLRAELTNPTCGVGSSCVATAAHIVYDLWPLPLPALPVTTSSALTTTPVASSTDIGVFSSVNWMQSYSTSCVVFDKYMHCFYVYENSLAADSSYFDYNDIIYGPSRPFNNLLISTSSDTAVIFAGDSLPYYVSSSFSEVTGLTDPSYPPLYSHYHSDPVADLALLELVHITSSLFSKSNIVFFFGKNLNLLGVRRANTEDISAQTVTGLDSLTGAFLASYGVTEVFSEDLQAVIVTTAETGRQLAGVVDFTESGNNRVFPADTTAILVFAFSSGYVRLCAGPRASIDVVAATNLQTLLQCQDAVLVSPNSEITAVVSLRGNAVAYVSTADGEFYILTPSAAGPGLLGVTKSAVHAGCHVNSLALHPVQTLLTFACSDARVASFSVDPVTGTLSELSFNNSPARIWANYAMSGLKSIAYSHLGSHLLLFSANDSKASLSSIPVATIAPVVTPAAMPAVAGIEGPATFTLQPPPLNIYAAVFYAVTFPQSTLIRDSTTMMIDSGVKSCVDPVLIAGNIVYSSFQPDCVNTTKPLKVTISNVTSGSAFMVGETALYAEFRVSSEAQPSPVSLEVWNRALPMFYSPRMPVVRKEVNVLLVDCNTGMAMPTVLLALVDYKICIKPLSQTLPTTTVSLSIGRVGDGDGPGSDPDDYVAPCLFTSVRSRHVTGFVVKAGFVLSDPLTIRCTTASESAGNNMFIIRTLFTDIDSKWQSAAFAVAPTITIALRVAQGSTVTIDPPTVPANVAVVVQSSWDVPPAENITVVLDVSSTDCVFSTGSSIIIAPTQFSSYLLSLDLTGMTCATPNPAGVALAAAVLHPRATAAMIVVSSIMRPVIGTLFLQGSSSNEPFVFSANNEYEVTLIASPTPTIALNVDLTMTRYGIPLPQMACHIVPSNVSSLSLLLSDQQLLKIKCSRPVAHEELVELQISAPDAAGSGYDVLNGNVITAYIGVTQNVWPEGGLVATLTTARLSLLPARPLSHKTLLLYEVLNEDVRCALSADKTALDHMTGSQAAFDAGDISNGISLNRYVSETQIGATTINVYALCDVSAVLFTVHVRYTVLKGTPLRGSSINTGVFELIVGNRMQVRSLVQPAGDVLIDNVNFKTQPEALRVEYAFYKAVNTLLHVTSDNRDACAFSSSSGETLGNEFDFVITNLTGTNTVLFECLEPRANVSLIVSRLASDNVTSVQNLTGPFHVSGDFILTLQADNSAAVTFIAGPKAVAEVSVPLYVPHALVITTAPLTAGVAVIAEIPIQSGKCAFIGANNCVTDAHGQCKMILSCDAPAQTPPSVVVRSEGLYSFVTVVSAPLQTKGNLVVEQLDLADNNQPYYLAGDYYRVRVTFDPLPEEPVLVRVLQSTTMASCLFSLTGDTSRMQRTIQWQHTDLADELVFGLICSRPHSVGSLIALETAAYMPFNLGPTVTYGRMSLEFRLPTGIVGSSLDVTDMAARVQLSSKPVGSQPTLTKPYYLRAPLTNMTTFRIRMQPAVVALTLINLRMTSAMSGCQFSITKTGGGSELLGSNAQVSAVLGETEHDVLISCELPKNESFSIVAEIASGSPYVPLVSMPMQLRGSVSMTTSGVAATSAFTGEIFSLRRWVMRFVLNPLPAESVTLTFAVVTGPNKVIVPSCRFYGETDADIADDTRENTLIFTPTMVMVGVAMICDVSLESSAFIQAYNNEELYDSFSSAPFRVRGAVWTEDAALPAYTQFPGTASSYVNVAVAVPHVLRVRVVPTWPQAADMKLSVNVTACGVGLTFLDGTGTVSTDGVAVSPNVDVTVPADTDTVYAFLLCSTVTHYIAVALDPRDSSTVFASTHITGVFSARNRFELRNLPSTLHAREAALIELGVLPLGAIAGVGQLTVVRVSTNSAFANCSVARQSGSSSTVPTETSWTAVNETASFLITISAVNAISLWVRCWQQTVNGAGVPVEGAVKPRFRFEYSSEIEFLPVTSSEISVMFIDCGAMPKLTHGNTIYDNNGFGAMAYLSRATASCETGYDLVTSAGSVVTCATLPCSWSATCQAAGWSEAPPSCVIHNCGVAPAADNKTVTGPTVSVTGDDGGATTYGAVLAYGCAEGYESSGTSASLRCTPSGWSQTTAPTCMAVTCPALTVGANTLQPIYSPTPNGMRRYLSTATYECLPGHTLGSGSLTLTCRADRTWSGTPPVCRTNMCLQISHDTSTQKPIVFSLNGKVTTADKTTGFFFVDTVAEYSCADGYSWVDPNSSRTRTCVYDEGWLPVLAPRCQPVPCPSLESIFYGSIKQEPAELLNLYGVTATYTCAYGATVTPQGNSISCMANGNWSGAPRTCQPYQCTSPAVFPSGQVQEITTGVNGAFSNNSIIEYRCNSGFNLMYPGVDIDTKYYLPTTTVAGATIEVGRRECTPNGWLPVTLPQCIINECSTLTGTSNVASITYFNINGAATPQYGTVATYTCGPGYETRDNNDILVANTRICGSRDQGWLPIDPPRCLPIDCGAISRIEIDNALPIEYTWDALTSKGPTRLAATATYNCKPGFSVSSGNNTFIRTCSSTRQWTPAEPTCSDINECDATVFNGRYFVNCTALHGTQSQCVNTFGSYICVPLVTTVPYLPYATSGNALFDSVENIFKPSSTAGGQRIKFAVRAGAGLVEPYFSRVRYLNPDKALYDDPAMLQYECTNVEVTAANEAARAAAGFNFYDVSCELSPGQGEGLYVSLQYCVTVYGRSEPDCTRWNWDWQGTRGTIDMEQIPINERVRVTYPMSAFIPRTLQSVTISGLTQMTDEYVSQTSLGEDIILAVSNFYLERPQLITMRYGEALTETDFPYICDFKHLMSELYSGYTMVIACHTQDRVNLIDLRFRLCIAGRCTVSSDRYSYPQIPEVTSVYGCVTDDILNGRTTGCPTDGGDVRLAVTGTGFLEPLSLIISGRQCTSLERANNTYFTCSLPVGAGESLSVTVKAGSQRTESRNRLSYASPTISGIRGCDRVSDVYIRECNRLGGNTIELTGHNFGATASTIMVGGQNCLNVTHDTTRPHERVTCITPTGSASERTVTLLQRYGTMSLENILLSYVQCSPGQYGVDVMCLPCETGYFNDMWSQTACRQCSPGLYSNTTGATSCTVCPAGHYSDLGSQSCGVCPRGTFSGERSGACTQCPPGTFAQFEGSSACEACPLAAESNEDYTFCRCTVGTYLNADGVCTKCMLGGDCTSPGTTIFNIQSLTGYAPSVIRHERDSVVRIRLYVPAVSSTEEARKAARATVTKLLYDNSDLPLDRIVLVGLEFLTEGELRDAKLSAEEAAKNGAANKTGNKSNEFISNIELMKRNNGGDTSVSLRDAYALVAVVDIDVYPSASGAYSLENSSEALYQRVVEQLTTNSAMLLSKDGSPVLTGDGLLRKANFERFATPSFELCINSACRGHDVCLEGHTGNLCAICLPGYGKSSSFECARCNGPALRTFLLVLAIIGAIAVCTVLVWKQIIDGKQSMNELPAPAVPLLLKVATSGLQVMSIAARYDLQWPGFLADVFDTTDTAGGVGTAFLSLDCFLEENPAVQPFWVTTISIMLLPLAGVLLPTMVFVPMYFSTRRRYRKELMKRAVEERALSAEVIVELKNREKHDRGEQLQQRREQMANENTLVWDLIDDKDGIAVESFVGTDPVTGKAVVHGASSHMKTHPDTASMPSTASSLRRGSSGSKVSSPGAGVNQQRGSISNVVCTSDNGNGAGHGGAALVSTGKKRRMIPKSRMTNSAGDVERAPLPPPVRPPAHSRADNDAANEEQDDALGEFEVSPALIANAPHMSTAVSTTASNAAINRSPKLGLGSTGLHSARASPVFGAVTITGESTSFALDRDGQRQAMLVAAANSPFMRPSLRVPTVTTTITGITRGNAEFGSRNSPAMSPAFTSVPDAAINSCNDHKNSPHIGAQTVAYGARASRTGQLSRVGSFSLLRSAANNDSPLAQPQRDRSPSASQLGSFSLTHLHRQSSLSGVRNVGGNTNAFAANDEVAWRSERAVRAFPHLTASSVSNITNTDNNGFIERIVDTLVASADAVAPAEFTASELEFRHNDFTDAVEDDDHKDDLSGVVSQSHTLTDGDVDTEHQDTLRLTYSNTAKSVRIGKRRSLRKANDFTASKNSCTSLSESVSSTNTDSTKVATLLDSAETSNTGVSFDLSRSGSVSSLTAASALLADDAVFVDEDGVAVDLREYAPQASRDFSLILDDFAMDMRARLDNADAAEGAYAAELAASTRTKAQELTVRAEWIALFNRYRTSQGDFDDALIKADAEKRVASTESSYEIANVLQDAADMENAFAVSCEPAETLYEAEVLRDLNIRRERAIERVRAHKQLMWYVTTYDEDKGKGMYEAAREQRAKAVKPRLTRAEMRKQLYAAEHALNNVFSEFAGYVITAITVVMFMIHPNITRQFFMVLSCKSIGGAADPGASFMLGDLSEPCYSAQHMLFILVLGVPMLIFWVIGIPLFAWAILYRNRALIQTPATGASDITRSQKKVFESQMAFLYRGYKPTRYYWFLLEMFRKAALVAIAVFFPGALHTQLMMASLLIFACILAQIFAKPFENRIPGAVEFLSLGTSFMIFFLANFLFIDTVSHTAKVVATILICVLVIFFFAVVVAAFVVLQREEMQLAPLRRQLREAYILGHDIQLVMRKWRQNKIREHKMRDDRKTLADSKRFNKSHTTTASGKLGADAVGEKVGAGERRSHDEVLVLGSSATPAWSRTFDLVRDEAASTDVATGMHRREAMMAAAAAAANSASGDGRELGANDAGTAAEDAIAGVEARRREREVTDDPMVVVDLTAPSKSLD